MSGLLVKKSITTAERLSSFPIFQILAHIAQERLASYAVLRCFSGNKVIILNGYAI